MFAPVNRFIPNRKFFKFFTLIFNKMPEVVQLSDLQKIEIFEDLVYHGKTPVSEEGYVLPLPGEQVTKIAEVKATRYEHVTNQFAPRKIPMNPAGFFMSDDRLIVAGKVGMLGKLTGIFDRSLLDDFILGVANLSTDIISFYFNAQRGGEDAIVYTTAEIKKKRIGKKEYLEICSYYSKTPRFWANKVITEDTSLCTIINEKSRKARSLSPLPAEHFAKFIR